MSWWPTWICISCHVDLWCGVTSLINFVTICCKVTLTPKCEQRFSIILLRHRKQICFSEIWAMLNHWFVFELYRFLISSTFLVTKNQNVLLEISVPSFSLLLFLWCVCFFVFVCCFTYLDLDLLGFLLASLHPFGFPTFLIELYGVNVHYSWFFYSQINIIWIRI